MSVECTRAHASASYCLPLFTSDWRQRNSVCSDIVRMPLHTPWKVDDLVTLRYRARRRPMGNTLTTLSFRLLSRSSPTDDKEAIAVLRVRTTSLGKSRMFAPGPHSLTPLVHGRRAAILLPQVFHY